MAGHKMKISIKELKNLIKESMEEELSSEFNLENAVEFFKNRKELLEFVKDASAYDLNQLEFFAKHLQDPEVLEQFLEELSGTSYDEFLDLEREDEFDDPGESPEGEYRRTGKWSGRTY